MKYCPQCNHEYEDETVFCSIDGSRLQARVPRAGQRAAAAPRVTAPAGSGNGSMSVLSSRPISALGATALQVPTPARGVSAPQRTRISQDSADTLRPPESGARAMSEGIDLELDPSELTTRQPAISTEMRAPGGPQEVEALDAPTVAMRSPVNNDTDEGAPSLVGVTVASRYKIVRRLGEGGMGVVYEGVDERLEKHVAIKVLREDFARRQDVVARFTQEAKSAARIKHENVLDVTDYGQTDDGSFYIAMELLVGTDLADVLQSDGVVSQERGVEVAMQVCRALQAAHGKGIVHRDLKPENIFLVRSDDGREVVKIVDFGIAQMKDITGSAEGSRKLTRTGMIFGTPEYMSPEQAAGKPVDHRVDIYAVGVILYEMFAGRVPFVGDTFMGILTKHMFEAPPPLRSVNPNAVVAVELEAVIAKALAKDAGQRYQSMQEFCDDLARFRSGARTHAAQSPPTYAAPPGQAFGAPYNPQEAAAVGPARTVEGVVEPAPRRRSMALLIAVIGLLAVGALALAFTLGKRDNPHPVVAPEPPRRVDPSPPRVTTGEPPRTNGAGAQPANPVAPVVPTPAVVPAAPVVPAVRRVTLRVTPEGFEARTITFAYVTAPADGAAIAPCTGEGVCERQVIAGAPLRVTAVGARRQGTATITPSRDGELLRVAASPRSNNARPPSGNAHAPPPTRGGSEVPCGSVDPRTQLMRVCL